jgi:hypothetical protein
MIISKNSEEITDNQNYINFVKLDLKVFNTYLLLLIPWVICYYFFSKNIFGQDLISKILYILKLINDFCFFLLSIVLITFPIYLISFLLIYAFKFKNFTKLKDFLLISLACLLVWVLGVFFGLGAASVYTTGNRNIFYEFTSGFLVISAFIIPLISYYSTSSKMLKSFSK